MPDAAQINRSLGSIRTELEYLASSGVLSPPQLQSIQAQLPVRHFLLHVPITSAQQVDRARKRRRRKEQKKKKAVYCLLVYCRLTSHVCVFFCCCSNQMVNNLHT